jgi:hypothetical protein
MGADAESIEELMGDVDRTLLRTNLKRSPAERLEKFVSFMRFTSELNQAGEKQRSLTVAGRQQLRAQGA